MFTRLVLIRHAIADHDGRLCGTFDVPLTAAGRAQVRALERCAPTRAPADALYASTLSRSTEVARALGAAWRLEPRPADWAREIHCGSVEGMPLDKLRRRYPDWWARNEAQADDEFAWPGGETYREFRARILSGLRGAAEANAGRRVAVVTHAGVIAQVLGTLRGRPPAVWSLDRPDPLTATEIAWEDGAPRALVRYNDPDWY